MNKTKEMTRQAEKFRVSGALFALLVMAMVSVSGCAWITGEPSGAAVEGAGDNATAATPPASAEAGQAQSVREPVKDVVQPSAAAQAPQAPVAEAPVSPPIPKAVPTAAGGYFLYPTVNDVIAASVQSERDGNFLGDIEPFEAFEYFPGPDTAGRAFKAGKKGELTVKYFAFHLPGKNFDRRVYGYVVDDGKGNFYGHFDTDANGIIDAHTMEPAMRFDLFEKLRPGQ